MPPPAPAGVRLVLSETQGDEGRAAAWIGPLLALGTRAARYSRAKLQGRQLVLVVSVPKRNYAAALVGCGWVLASEAPALAEPLCALRTMTPGQPLRAVNSAHV